MARVATQQAAAFAAVLRERGDTLQAIATRLNHTGFRTRYGSLWSPTQAKRILDRLPDTASRAAPMPWATE